MHHVSCYALTVYIRPKSHRFLDNHRCLKGEILEFERNGTWHWCGHIRKECLEQNEEESNRMRELKTLIGYRSTSVRQRFITTVFPPLHSAFEKPSKQWCVIIFMLCISKWLLYIVFYHCVLTLQSFEVLPLLCNSAANWSQWRIKQNDSSALIKKWTCMSSLIYIHRFQTDSVIKFCFYSSWLVERVSWIKQQQTHKFWMNSVVLNLVIYLMKHCISSVMSLIASVVICK